MEHLHLIRDERIRDLVRRVAQNDTTLTTFDGFNYCYANIWLALGHALRGNTCLRRLRLGDIVLTKEAAHALSQGMAQSKIEILDLSSTCRVCPTQELSSLLQERICNIFYRGIQASTTIQELHLYHSWTQDPKNAWRDALLGTTSIVILLKDPCDGYIQDFSEVMSSTTLLRGLTLELDGGLEADDITTLAHGLYQNTSITSLCLSNYFITCEHNQLLLAQGLSPNSTISKLKADQFDIDDDSVELLADRWLPNCPIQQLLLRHNNIGPSGARRLVQAITNHPTMLELDLSNNVDIGYDGLRTIGNELANLQHLTDLNLYHCSTWNIHLKAESEKAQARTRACHEAGQALLDGIKRNRSITKLDVASNYFSQQVEGEIRFYVALNVTGRRLLSTNDDHGLAASVWCHVLEKCQRQRKFRTSLMYFYLNEQPTLVQSRPCGHKRKRS